MARLLRRVRRGARGDRGTRRPPRGALRGRLRRAGRDDLGQRPVAPRASLGRGPVPAGRRRRPRPLRPRSEPDHRGARVRVPGHELAPRTRGGRDAAPRADLRRRWPPGGSRGDRVAPRHGVGGRRAQARWLVHRPARAGRPGAHARGGARRCRRRPRARERRPSRVRARGRRHRAPPATQLGRGPAAARGDAEPDAPRRRVGTPDLPGAGGGDRARRHRACSEIVASPRG